MQPGARSAAGTWLLPVCLVGLADARGCTSMHPCSPETTGEPGRMRSLQDALARVDQAVSFVLPDGLTLLGGFRVGGGARDPM